MSTVTLNLQELKKAELWLQALQLRGQSASGLMHELGEALVNQTIRRIKDDKSGPDGTPWKGWCEDYAAWRSKNSQNPGMGILSGQMLGSIDYRLINQYAMEWGSSAEYAGYFNGDEEHGWNRPFVGLSEANEEELEDVAEAYFAMSSRRAE